MRQGPNKQATKNKVGKKTFNTGNNGKNDLGGEQDDPKLAEKTIEAVTEKPEPKVIQPEVKAEPIIEAADDGMSLPEFSTVKKSREIIEPEEEGLYLPIEDSIIVDEPEVEDIETKTYTEQELNETNIFEELDDVPDEPEAEIPVESDPPVEEEEFEVKTFELDIEEIDDNVSTVLATSLTKEEANRLSNEWTTILDEEAVKAEKFRDAEATKADEDPNYNPKEYVTDVVFGDKEKIINGAALDTRTQFNDIESINSKGSNDHNIITNKNFKPKNASSSPQLYFSSFLGISVPVTIILPTSGFAITIKYPNKAQRNAFWKMYNDNRNNVGFNDSEVSLDSFESFHINKQLINLLKILTVSSTLDVENPIDYILFGDMRVIQLAIQQSIYPTGLPITIPCDGVSELRNKSNKCQNKISGRILPNTLVYVDFDKMNDITKSLLMREEKGSVSLEEYKEAKSKLPTHSVTVNVFGGVMKFFFDQATLPEYITFGGQTMAAVREYVEDSFDEKDVAEETLLELSTNPIRKNIYLSKIWTKDIEIDNRLQTDGKETNNIKTMLVILRDQNALEAYIKGLYEFENMGYYDVGLAKYNCGCGHPMGNDKGLLPINPLRFLTVGVSIKA